MIRVTAEYPPRILDLARWEEERLWPAPREPTIDQQYQPNCSDTASKVQIVLSAGLSAENVTLDASYIWRNSATTRKGSFVNLFRASWERSCNPYFAQGAENQVNLLTICPKDWT